MSKRKVFDKESISLHWLEDDRFKVKATDRCWICMTFTKHLQKCHLQALSKGGDDHLDNLVLLCPTCHRETEGMSNNDFWHHVETYTDHFWIHTLKRAYNLDLVSSDMYSRLEKEIYKRKMNGPETPLYTFYENGTRLFNRTA
jgi:hypothetical protein